MFTCPRCRTELATLRRREGLSWVCPQCEGRAVRTSTVSRTVSRQLTARLWAQARADPLPSALLCPSCGGPMCASEIQAGEDSVLLDLCRPCGIVWFDGGEMEIVTDPILPVAHPARAVDSASKVDRDTVVARFELEHLREMSDSDPRMFDPDARWKYVPAALGLPVDIESGELEHRPWLTW